MKRENRRPQRGRKAGSPPASGGTLTRETAAALLLDPRVEEAIRTQLHVRGRSQIGIALLAANRALANNLRAAGMPIAAYTYADWTAFARIGMTHLDRLRSSATLQKEIQKKWATLGRITVTVPDLPFTIQYRFTQGEGRVGPSPSLASIAVSFLSDGQEVAVEGASLLSPDGEQPSDQIIGRLSRTLENNLENVLIELERTRYPESFVRPLGSASDSYQIAVTPPRGSMSTWWPSPSTLKTVGLTVAVLVAGAALASWLWGRRFQPWFEGGLSAVGLCDPRPAILISWTTSRTEAVSFRVMRDGIPFATIRGRKGEGEYRDTSAPPGVVHTYNIEALDRNGERIALAGPVQASLGPCPPEGTSAPAPTPAPLPDDETGSGQVNPPLVLLATPMCDGRPSIRLTWKNSDSRTTRLRVKRNSLVLKDLPAEATSYVDEDIRAGEWYSYWVKAGDRRGWGPGDSLITTARRPVCIPGNRPPTCQILATPRDGSVPVTDRAPFHPLGVHLQAVGSDPDGDALTFAWDFGNDDQSAGPLATGRYFLPGAYVVTLHVTDGYGGNGICTETITVRPEGPK